jgi:hypothetical protein
LAPAWARQDHTSSPSALLPLVSRHIRVHRIPLHVRDDRDTPLVSVRNGLSKSRIPKKRNNNIFAGKYWTTQISLMRLEKFDFPSMRVRRHQTGCPPGRGQQRTANQRRLIRPSGNRPQIICYANPRGL